MDLSDYAAKDSYFTSLLWAQGSSMGVPSAEEAISQGPFRCMGGNDGKLRVLSFPSHWNLHQNGIWYSKSIMWYCPEEGEPYTRLISEETQVVRYPDTGKGMFRNCGFKMSPDYPITRELFGAVWEEAKVSSAVEK